VVGWDEMAAIKTWLGVFLVAVGAALLAVGRNIRVEVEAAVALLIPLVAGQRVLDGCRPARR
jgi:hypothetical protein